jgi:hypothetical protein
VALLIVIPAILLISRFTSRTDVDEERMRARIFLQSIYRIEQSHFQDHGTYLPISREKNGPILKLKDAPGRFRYRVEATDSTFVAIAEANLDADDELEVWQVDARNPEPILINRDR